MNIIRRYLGKTALIGIILALFFLVGLRMLFLFMDDLPNVGKHQYTMPLALTYLFLHFPVFLYEFLPMGTLVGLMGALGLLASRNELTIVRAIGLSPSAIIMACGRMILPFVALIILVGEFMAPTATQWAQEIHRNAVSGGRIVASGKGLWAKDEDLFVYIGQVVRGVTREQSAVLNDVRLFQLDENFRVQGITLAKRATYQGNHQWRLVQVTNVAISEDKITRQPAIQQVWHSQLTPTNLDSADLQPDAMNIVELYRFIDFLKLSQLDAGAYELAFWRKVFQPITIIVMMMLGGAMVFGSIRHVSVGVRLLSGVLIGLGFWTLNEIFGPFSLVYGISPFFGVLLPVGIIALLAHYRLSRLH